MGFAMTLLSLFNAAEPGIATILMLIRRTDGTVVIVPFLDEASATFSGNLAQAADWFKAHPTPDAAPR